MNTIMSLVAGDWFYLQDKGCSIIYMMVSEGFPHYLCVELRQDNALHPAKVAYDARIAKIPSDVKIFLIAEVASNANSPGSPEPQTAGGRTTPQIINKEGDAGPAKKGRRLL